MDFAFKLRTVPCVSLMHPSPLLRLIHQAVGSATLGKGHGAAVVLRGALIALH